MKVAGVLLFALSMMFFTPACGYESNLDSADDGGSGSESEGDAEDGNLPQVEIDFVGFKMAILGDSISVGLLGDTKMGEVLDTDHEVLGALMDGDPATNPQMLGHDDYYKSTFDNAFSNAVHCGSLACRVEHNFHVANLAVSGARAKDVDAMLGKAEDDTSHFVLEIGSNDFCATDFDKGKFIEKMGKLTQSILNRDNYPQLLVVPIPDIHRLFADVAPSDETAFHYMPADRAAVPESYSCGEIRDAGLVPAEAPQDLKDKAKFCGRVSDAVAEDVANGDTVLMDALKTELKEVNDAIIALKEDEKRLVVAESIATFEFTSEHIAADCFHPSKAGLEVLASKTFKVVEDSWKPYSISVKVSAPKDDEEDES